MTHKINKLIRARMGKELALLRKEERSLRVKQSAVILLAVGVTLFLTLDSCAALATQVGKVHGLFKDHIIKTGLVVGCGVGGIAAVLKGSFVTLLSILAAALALSFALSLIEGGDFLTLFSR